MSRTDLATLSGQCLGKWGTQSERLPHRDGKGLERSHVQVACGGQQLVLTRAHAHLPRHAGPLKSKSQH